MPRYVSHHDACSPCRSIVRISLPALFGFGVLASPMSAWANDREIERAQLELTIRQLDVLERTARHAAMLPRSTDTRYRFDYPRLLDDITRVRGGIQDYLTPPRAQPRDSAELHGDYTRERDDRSDTSCR